MTKDEMLKEITELFPPPVGIEGRCLGRYIRGMAFEGYHSKRFAHVCLQNGDLRILFNLNHPVVQRWNSGENGPAMCFAAAALLASFLAEQRSFSGPGYEDPDPEPEWRLALALIPDIEGGDRGLSLGFDDVLGRLLAMEDATALDRAIAAATQPVSPAVAPLSETVKP